MAEKTTHTILLKQTLYFSAEIEAESREEALSVARDACEEGSIEDYDLDNYKTGDFIVTDEE